MRSFSFPGSTPVSGGFFAQDERVQIITHVRPRKKTAIHRGRPRGAKRTHPLRNVQLIIHRLAYNYFDEIRLKGIQVNAIVKEVGPGTSEKRVNVQVIFFYHRSGASIRSYLMAVFVIESSWHLRKLLRGKGN